MSETQNGAVVVAHDVTRRYGEGDTAVDALRGVSVDIAPGKATAVMGPSGSGKSTLMHILAGLDKPTSGSVGIAGTEITTLGDNDLTKLRREHIGFVFQFFNLLPMLDAKENILLPLTIAGEKPEDGWFDKVVSDVGLGDRLTHRPSELSGGQQQRVAIARALISKPTVLFADEPTGNLDSSTSAEILELLRRSVDEYGQTIVMVTHDARAAAIAHRVLFLADGSIFRELGECDAHDDPHRHGRARRARDQGRSSRPRGAQAPRGPDRHRDRPRRRDDQRHLHPHGHDQPRVHDALHGVVRRNRRGRHGEGPRHLDRRRGAAEPARRRVAARDRSRCRRCRARDRLGARRAQHEDPHPGRRGRQLGGRADVRVRHRHVSGARPVQSARTPRGPLASDGRRGRHRRGHGRRRRATRSATRSRSRPCSRSARSSSSASRSTAASTASGTRASRSSRSRRRRSFSIARGSTTRSRSRRTKASPRTSSSPRSSPLCRRRAKVVSATAEAEEQVDEVNEFTAIFRYFLLVFAGIALFVGAFVIFNTFSITVAQRTREFATLRTIGASRRQILGSVILESLRHRTSWRRSSVLGLGVLLAEGIEGLFRRPRGRAAHRGSRLRVAHGDRGARSSALASRSLAGLFPAIRATRVPPIAAVREGATLPKSRFAPFVPWIAGSSLAALVILAARCSPTSSARPIACSRSGRRPALFLGVAMLSSHVVRPLAAISSRSAAGPRSSSPPSLAVLAPPVLARPVRRLGTGSALRRAAPSSAARCSIRS